MPRSRFRWFAILMPMVAAVSQAQPFLYYRGIVNAASQMPGGLPGGAVARGAIFSISGRNFGSGSATIAITQGGTTVGATAISVTPDRIDAVMPSNAPLGLSSVRVTANNVRSNPMPVQIVSTQFGIFTNNGAGNGPSISSVIGDDGTLTPMTLQSPTAPGQAVALSGTGLGNAALSAIEVYVGGTKASILNAQPANGDPFKDAIQFLVPDDAPLGCWTPVYVKTSATAVSNFATMAISSDGRACTEPDNPLASALINGGRIGSYAVARLAVRHDAGVRTPRDASTDLLGAYQAAEEPGPANFHPIFSLPPARSCAVYSGPGEFSPSDMILPRPTLAALVSGGITLTGSKGEKAAAETDYPGISLAEIAGAIPSLPFTNTTFLDPGAFTLNLAGGADIGSASADTTAPQPFAWTNRDQTLAIDRTKGIPVSWIGGDPDSTVLIVGHGSDLPSNASSVFICRTLPGTSSFTVPADVIANIPASRASGTQSLGAVYVGKVNLGNPSSLAADGLDFGSLLSIFVNGKTVRFQ